MQNIDLLKSGIMLRSLFDHSGDAIFIYDLQGEILDVNRSACKRLGYSREELLRMNMVDLESKDVAFIHERIEEIKNRGQIIYVATLVRKDGETVSLEMNSSIVEFDDKKAILSIARDITERMKLEEELKRNRNHFEENYKELANSIDGIVWEVDAKTFRFTFVSKKAEQILGYPVECWSKEPKFWEKHLHPEDKWAVSYRKKATTEKKNYKLEYRMIAADGQTLWLKDIVNVVIEDGKAVKLRGIMVDITERKKAEIEYQKVDRALRTLSMCNQAVMLAKNESELCLDWFC